MPAHPLHAIAASAAEALARPLVPAPRARGALGSRAPRERASVLHAAAAAIRSADPRLYQIAALSLLLGYGVVRLRFEISATYVLAMLLSALSAQWAGTRLARLPRFDPLSAVISALGLATLLRTPWPAMGALAAALAVASKFVIRWNGKHLFNPTNLAVVAMLAFGAPVWVSPGQYGHLAFFAIGIEYLVSAVVNRAARSDVTFAFLVVWAGIVFGRSAWLGEPMSIPLHRLENGMLLQFAFFMISDPRTTPASRAGRILFAALVALGAGYVQFRLFRTNGLLWSLFLSTLAVPVLDRVLPGARYEWKRVSSRPDNPKGASDETKCDRSPAVPGPAAAAIR